MVVGEKKEARILIDRKQYEISIAIIFGLLLISNVLVLFFDVYTIHNLLIEFKVMYIALLLIAFMEINYTEPFFLELIGWGAIVAIVIGFVFKIIHFDYYQMIISVALVILVILFIENYKRIDRFHFLHILLRLFIVLRIISVLFRSFREVLQIIDQILLLVIPITAWYFLIKKRTKTVL